MKTAIFKNFSNEPFTGYWDGKPKTFQPGKEIYIPDYLAKHFAKHLTNRELLKLGKERSTSPKKPNEVPEFMEMFNKAYQEDEDVDTSNDDPVDIQIKMANSNRKNGYEQKGPPIVVDVPGLEDDEDGEDGFEGKPVDKSTDTE